MAEPSLFTTSEKNVFVALTIYVYDLILASNNEAALNDIKDYLYNYFSIKGLGKLKYILGLEIAGNKEGIHLYHHKYALDLLAEYGFLDCKPASTPISMDKVDNKKTKKL